MRRISTVLCGLAAMGLVACSNELKVSELDPPHGAFTGGEEVVLKGNGFQPGRGGVTVKFGRKDAAAVVVESSGTIKVTTPAGDKNTTVDILVVFDDGKSFQIKNGFHYVDTTQQRATMDKALGAFGDTTKKDEPKK
jgi:IPT/TIG domain